MRAIAPELQARLDGGATTLCRCWRVRRRDGVALGFTDHDRDLGFEETLFRASSGMDTSGAAVGDRAERRQCAGDGRAERRLGARGGHPRRPLRRGRGLAVAGRLAAAGPARADVPRHLRRDPTRSGGGFEVELRGLGGGAERAGRPDVSCRAATGRSATRSAASTSAQPGFSGRGQRARRGFGAARRSRRAGSAGLRTAGSGTGRLTWLFGRERRARRGTVEARSGRVGRSPAAGRSGRSRACRLRPAIGSGVAAGCDKRPETCRGKFANFLNFRGFPHIPGDDWVTAYPEGWSATMTGGSRAELTRSSPRRAAWIGTPYRHQASCRGAGTDCLGLLRGIWRELIGPEPEAVPRYTPRLVRAGAVEDLSGGGAGGNLLPIDRAEARPGDVAGAPDARQRRGQARRHSCAIAARGRDADPCLFRARGGRIAADAGLGAGGSPGTFRFPEGSN